MSSCLHSCWPHPDFLSPSLSLLHPRHGHGIFLSTILPLHSSPPQPSVGRLPHPLVLLSLTGAHYFMSCTVIAPFSRLLHYTVSPSSPHPIWASFSYPLFFSFCLMPIPWARRKQYEGPTQSWGLLSLIYFSSSLFSEVYPSKYIEYLAQLIIFRLSSPTDVWHTMLLCLLFSQFIFCHIFKPPFPQTPYSHHPYWTHASCSNTLMYILALFSTPFLLLLILSAPLNHKDTCS